MSQSLPDEQIKANALKYKLLAEAKQKHIGSLCWGCPCQDDKFMPYPCQGRKRWQTEGFCTKKQFAETKLKTQSNGQKRME